MQKVIFSSLLGILLLFFLVPGASAQPSFSFDLKKPKKYEERQLRSEKTGEKKFTFPRRAYQNTVTHYNWYFNASNRLNEILDRAKSTNVDDYSKLLNFYNYGVEITARDSIELDSVIYKANAGILLHDLRNAWIDNMYMLMGKAYFFKGRLDSAYQTFQYINYAFSPKEKDGYDKTIGSNDSEGGSAFTISTKENNSLLKKLVSTPPSRNESFLWQIKTFLEQDALTDAAVLIETLRRDPVFPERLQTDLKELQAYYFYKQQNYDSAAFYLSQALGNAGNQYELSRWEYLIAQLYERTGKSDLAVDYYNKAIRHSLDPVMEVFARLNSIRQNKGDSLAIQRNIDELVKMGRRDRYERYADIIYYTAAQIELERNNIPGAKLLLQKAALASKPDAINSHRSKAYLLLGDLSFAMKEFPEAKSYYDSLQVGDPVIIDFQAFETRLETLTKITEQVNVIKRQDSLMTLAKMPAAEREALLKKKVRALRKAQGLAEDETTIVNPVNIPGKNDGPADLFNTNEKGDWYFYNNALKSKGYTAFVSKWGKRPNVDNWRRSIAVNQATVINQQQQNQNTPVALEETVPQNSVEALLKGIPLTGEQQAASEDSVKIARIELGQAYLNGLEEYQMVIDTLESFPAANPVHFRLPEVLYMLFVSYRQTGQDAKAEQVLSQMQAKYAGDPLERQMTMSSNRKTVTSEQEEITRTYDQIYNSFIEGRFEQAIAQKKLADEKYGQNYWTPQLLYINAIYLIRQRQDAEAKVVLGQIIEVFRDQPMATKAQELLDVLNRRKEIEEYLTNLKIERPADDAPILVDQPAPIKRETVITEEPSPLPKKEEPVKEDTKEVPVKEPVVVKTEPKPEVKAPPKAVDTPVVKTKEPEAAVVKKEVPPVKTPVQVKTDTVKTAPTTTLARNYSHDPNREHLVVMVTTKVDPVYITESKNAFNRFNSQRYSGLKSDNVLFNDDIKMLLISGFANAAEAKKYAADVRSSAPTSIIPWLPVGKYYFIVINSSNYELLQQSKTLEDYKKFEAQFLKD